MIPAHQRLAELSTINQRRQLTPEELQEVAYCMSLNQRYVWERIKLETLSLLASETADVDWQHEICARIEALEITGRIPGRRD